MLIDNSNTYRVIISPDRKFEFGNTTEFFSGNYKTAIHSAVKDIEAIGEGACFRIEKRYDAYNDVHIKDVIKCGEVKNGEYFPRNNL